MDAEQKQVALFLTLIFFVVFSLLITYVLGLLKPLVLLLIIGVVLAVFYAKVPSFAIMLREYERAVVFRFGRYVGIKGPGWVILIPFVDSYKIIDLRAKTVDIPIQEVVTADNIKLKIDAIIYIKVKDPEKAVLNVKDYEKAAVSNIQASLRAVIGKMKLSEVISNIDKINELLRKGTEEVTKDWGVEVEKVEIQSVTLPEGVQRAMHELKEAEQKKLAAKELAEGTKIKLSALQEAASKFTDPTLKYLYLQSLQKIAEGKSSKIIFPMELSRLAAGISEKFGVPFEKTQERLLAEYSEKREKGEKPESIIESLKKEYGVKLEELVEETKTKKTKAKAKKKTKKASTKKTKPKSKRKKK